MERIVKPERDKENKVTVMSTPNAKRVVLTGAVTAITIAGTLYGAGIKTNQEVAQKGQKTRETTIDEHIVGLRETRQNLTSRKELVEKQLRDLEMRIEDRRQKSIGGNSR